MLPLWIIDLNQNKKRCDIFLDRLSRISGALLKEKVLEGSVVAAPVAKEQKIEDDNNKQESSDLSASTENSTEKGNKENLEPNEETALEKLKQQEQDSGETVENSTVSESDETPVSQSEILKDVTLAEQIAKVADDVKAKFDDGQDVLVEGQWFYSHFDNPFPSDDSVDEATMAQLLYDFKEAIVEQGQKFMETLRSSYLRTDININVCVIGHVEEPLTQMVFASIAALIQLEKPRILPNHVHQGISIFGMLFVPTSVNTGKRTARQRVLRCLREIEVQHDITSAHGYDKMLFFQDSQNRTEKIYPRMSLTQQVEYVVQCLVNLFYATNREHPLISGTVSSDHFYLSMGVASLYYDHTNSDLEDRISVANGILTSFKADGTNEKEDPYVLVEDDDIAITTKLDKIISDLNLDTVKIDLEKPDPHPIKDFNYKHLLRLYYHTYLRNFPDMLMTKIMQSVSKQTQGALEKINAECKTQLAHFKGIVFSPGVKKLLIGCNDSTGGVQRVENKVKELQNRLSDNKKDIDRLIFDRTWNRIQDTVDSKLADAFREYHLDYCHDYESQTEKEGPSFKSCEAQKKDAQDALQNILSEEPTVLGRFVRVFLYGIILVLFLLPILEFISPRVIDLGNVARHAFAWAFFFFLIPTIWQLISYWLTWRRERYQIRRLKAYYLHDAYARVTNAIKAESEYFYKHALALCDEYLKRCERIRNEVKPYIFESTWTPDIPNMMFNQPLVGGQFMGERLFPGEFIDFSKVMINQKPTFVNELTAKEYYSLIRLFKDQMSILFDNVTLSTEIERDVDEETGKSYIISPYEVKKRREEKWQKMIAQFKEELYAVVCRQMVPRKFATIDSKVIHYVEMQNKKDVLYPMLDICATNGEFTTDASMEFADVKCTNEKMIELVNRDLPLDTVYQVDGMNDLYGKFLFVTRWRSFDKISANRILPEISIDLPDSTEQETSDEDREESKKKQHPYSSIFLYSLCGDDSDAAIWTRLFSNQSLLDKSHDFVKNYISGLHDRSVIFNETLNQRD